MTFKICAPVAQSDDIMGACRSAFECYERGFPSVLVHCACRSLGQVRYCAKMVNSWNILFLLNVDMFGTSVLFLKYFLLNLC